MSPTDAETLMLLVAHFLALGVATMLFLWLIYLHRRKCAMAILHVPAGDVFPSHSPATIRPATWLAVRSLESEEVRGALPDKDEFFISPRVNGWVIVTGPGLPDPSEDVDGCFRFLTALSRRLGHVQYFHTEPILAHHAWVRMDEGCVTRAYAWAGETLWNQGAKTLAENELGLKCRDYGEDSEPGFGAAKEHAAANLERIPLLAARWSLDPEILHRTEGGGGESSRFY